jgi:hypothetical protein
MASTTQEIERLEGRIERLEEEVKKILNLIQQDEEK